MNTLCTIKFLLVTLAFESRVPNFNVLGRLKIRFMCNHVFAMLLDTLLDNCTDRMNRKGTKKSKGQEGNKKKDPSLFQNDLISYSRREET